MLNNIEIEQIENDEDNEIVEFVSYIRKKFSRNKKIIIFAILLLIIVFIIHIYNNMFPTYNYKGTIIGKNILEKENNIELNYCFTVEEDGQVYKIYPCENRNLKIKDKNGKLIREHELQVGDKILIEYKSIGEGTINKLDNIKEIQVIT